MRPQSIEEANRAFDEALRNFAKALGTTEFVVANGRIGISK